MKKYNFKIAAGLISIFIMFNSCKKWIDPEVNDDPNKSATTTLALLLPGTQVGLGYGIGGDVSYYALIWMQQIAGGANQPLAYDRYNVSAGDVDNAWLVELYGGPMKDINVMINKAAELNSPWYKGIGEVEMALALGVVTDLWGDAPYSEAFQGAANLTPKFDKQQDIYNSINKLLDQAIVDLSSTESKFGPEADDVIYGGDLGKWTKAAYALKARYAIHLSKRDANAYSNALTALANGFADNSDDFLVNYQKTQSGSNPFFQFNQQRGGDIGTAAFVIDTMFSINDPRLPAYFDTTYFGPNGYVGLLPGIGGYYCDYWGSYFISPNSPANFMTYVEQKFIEAEAQLGLGHADLAAEAYNTGLKASINKFVCQNLIGSDSIASFENKYAKETASSITLKKIIIQKYLSCYFQVEVYNDWRRTGYPEFKKYPPTLSKANLPLRYPYPTSERNYNPNCPKNITAVTPIWLYQ